MSRPPTDPSTVPGDDELAGLVRHVVAGWTMPTDVGRDRNWAERTGRRPRATRIHGLGRRVGQAAGLAVAATVVLALAAIWLTAPHVPAGGPSASLPTGPVGSASAQPGPTPLPAFAQLGALPAQTKLVLGGGGTYQVLDLATGQLAAPFLVYTDAGGLFLARPGGGFVCACPTTVSTPTSDGLAVTIRLFGPLGATTGSFNLGPAAGTYLGQTDPAAGGSPSDQGPSAAIDAAVSPDGAYLYVGWAVRRPPMWRSGIDVVDLATGSIIQTVDLPDVGSSDHGTAVYAWAPHVTISPAGASAVIRGTRVQASNATYAWWSVKVDNERLSSLTAFATGPGTLDACGSDSIQEGFATNASYFALCGSASSNLVFRRVDLLGRPLGDTLVTTAALSPFPGIDGGIVDRAAGAFFAWDAFDATLVRIDLASGQVTGRGSAPSPSAAASDPVGAIGAAVGRWLAPAAQAKTYLQPATALSADGSRLYALGVEGATPGDPNAGSSGVWVFDTQTLAVVAHWSPLADLVSIAVSPDGTVVFAAGASGVDRTGQQSDQAASVTGYDATSGAVRLIYGQLGNGYLDLAPGDPGP